ncbi:hypothetical protein ACWEOZ_19445 [Actinoplanes sp. NPDC004185]
MQKWKAAKRSSARHTGWRKAFPTPAGEIRPTGNRIDVPTADLRYLRDGIESFNCYNAANVLLAQIGAGPDFKSAVEPAKAATTAG